MPVVGPIKDTSVPAVYDTDSGGFGGPYDMNGPEIGVVSYTQPSGNLVLKIKVEFGEPNTSYQVFLVCGPSHAAACGFINIGTLSTDAVGSGSAGITVPAAALQSAPFGPGFRNDHIDMLGGKLNSALVAGAINYFVCKRKTLPGAAKIPQIMAEAQAGDPRAGKSKLSGKKR